MSSTAKLRKKLVGRLSNVRRQLDMYESDIAKLDRALQTTVQKRDRYNDEEESLEDAIRRIDSGRPIPRRWLDNANR